MPISDEMIRASILMEVEREGPPPDLWERVQRRLVARQHRSWTGRMALAAVTTLALLVMLPGPRTLAFEWVRSIFLPNGRVITPQGQTPLDNSVATVAAIGIAKSGDPVLQVIGNHAEVLNRQEVTIPAGKAILALVERSESAAAGPAGAQHEYWLIVLRPHPQREDMLLAYALVATVTGDEQAAKAEILRVARSWQVP